MISILMVEDQESLHALYRNLLERLNYSVVLARTGREGIAELPSIGV